MTPLTVLQLCADRGIAPGSTKGAAQHLRGIAAGLSSTGHRVATYAARRPEGPYPVPVNDLADLGPDQVRGADVIYERYSLGHRLGLDLARAIGVRFVLEVNAPLVDEAQEHRRGSVEPDHRDVEDTLLREADLVITVSRALTDWVRRVRSGPTITVPNGFEPAWFGVPPSPATEPTLAFIGHPKPWHGADRLPTILRDLTGRGHRPRLLIIGGGPGADEVMDHAHEAGVADQITVTGPLPPEEASAALAQATIGIAPYSARRPFYFCPLKVLDYLAAGLPVVTTDQGDIPHLVGDAGIVVDPDSDRALTDAVAELLSDPDKAHRIGARGRQRAHATMTWEAGAATTAAAIQALDSSLANA